VELIADVFSRHLSGQQRRLDVTWMRTVRSHGSALTDQFYRGRWNFRQGCYPGVHGTVNDLAVSGAQPLYLTLNSFIEEGLEIDRLERIVASLARSAAAVGVLVVAGDTVARAGRRVCATRWVSGRLIAGGLG
jgi:hydrogenase expression/formation protein HypE